MAKKKRRDPDRGPALNGVKMRLPDGRRQTEKGLWNTSLGGLFIEMTQPMPFGSEVDLEFAFPRSEPNISCSGFVVWSTTGSQDRAPGKRGICVRLADIEIGEMRRLAAAVGQDLEE